MLKRIPLFVLLSILITSCSGESESSAKNDEPVETAGGDGMCETAACDGESYEDYAYESEPHVPNPEKFTGFIGNSAITAILDFNYNDNLLSGSYVYDAYNKKITLSGEVTDWYGGGIYTLYEMNTKGDTTGQWEYFTFKDNGTWGGIFRKPGEEEKLDIVLTAVDGGVYMHPEAKMTFESKERGDEFFEHHYFLHHEIADKQGVIVNNDPDESSFSRVLPTGLTIYTHDGGDGFGVEPMGVIDSEGRIKYEDGDVISLDSYGITDIMEIGYEIKALRFQRIVTSEYVSVNAGKNYEVYVNIKELEEKNFHLEGDGHWIKEKSGSVLGFFPSNWSKGMGEKEGNTIHVYKDRNSSSKKLLSIYGDREGYISLNDLTRFKDEYWAKITFNYHTQVPCEDEVREARPSVTGWIKLYQHQNLVLDFYSRGC